MLPENYIWACDESPGDYTFRQLFNFHNRQADTLLVWSTLKQYFVTQRYLVDYFRVAYDREDYLLSKLDYPFIAGFEQFLYRKSRDQRRPLHINGVMKHLSRVRKMINLAMQLEWLDKMPFRGFKLRKKEVDKPFMNRLELKKLEQTVLHIPRLRAIRDMFVFSCYTGLAFVDMMGLTREHIVTGLDGEPWIKSYRKKTATAVNTPLLPPALNILNNYLPGAMSPKDFVFSRISNQKMNDYLKELAHHCGITKNLTFHIARHTFATTVTLSNGVPIETVSKMLGHTQIATTQVYARVLEDKISQDMNALKQKLDRTA